MGGFNGMSTHLGHVMPKRNMSKTMGKMRQNIPSVYPNPKVVRLKVCIGDLTDSDVLI